MSNLREEFYQEFNVDDSLGITRCGDCGGVVKEDSPGAAMKFLGLSDCDCDEEESE